jgi:hypothetical protein
VEEISSSMILSDDSGGDGAVEELSGSVLIEDPPDGTGVPIIKKTMVEPAPAKPAVPLGLPELPRTTPGPSHVHGPGPARPGASSPQGVASLAAAPPGASGEPPDPAAELPTTQYPFRSPLAPLEPAGGAGSALNQPATTAGSGGNDAGGKAALPPRTIPSVILQDDIEVTTLPRSPFARLRERATNLLAAVKKSRLPAALRSGFAHLPAALREGASVPPKARPRWFLPVIAASGLTAGVGLVILIAGVDKGDRESASSSGSTASALPSLSAAPALSNAAATPAPTPTPALLPCTVAGAPQTIGPSATLAAGVEARPFGDEVALGFATGDHDATGVRLDAASLSATGTASGHSTDAIRRVRPVAGPKGTMSLAIDTDHKGDSLRGRRALPFDPPLQVGQSGGDIAWAHFGRPPSGKLWPIDGDDGVGSLRGASEGAPGDTTTTIAFRHGDAIWMGSLTGYKALSTKGELAKVAGLGGSVGSPAVALNDGVAIVAWADHATADEPWKLRWVRFRAGEAPGAPNSFAPPGSSPDAHAMSPAIAAVPGGRFLLVWTDGPTSHHRVRALTISSDGSPIGGALEISEEGLNAGGGQAAVSTAGKGVVAFLGSSDSGFQVMARSIACASPP